MSMDDFYTRINWENYPTEDTPLSDANLNKMDYALKVLSQRTATLDANKLEIASYPQKQGILYYDYSGDGDIKASGCLEHYEYPPGDSTENFILFASSQLSEDSYQFPLYQMWIQPNSILFTDYNSDAGGEYYEYNFNLDCVKQVLGLVLNADQLEANYSLHKYADTDYTTNRCELGIMFNAPLDYENPSDGCCHAIYSTKGISYYDDDQNVLTEIPLADLANVIGTTSNIQTQFTALNSTLMKSATNLITTGLSFNKCDYICGGYCQIGNMVIVELSVKTNTSVAAWDTLVSGMPRTYTSNSINISVPLATFNVQNKSLAPVDIINTIIRYIGSTSLSSDVTLNIGGIYLTEPTN